MIKLGIFFGGKSVEHEISVITMSQAISAIDENKYEIVPIYTLHLVLIYILELFHIYFHLLQKLLDSL